MEFLKKIDLKNLSTLQVAGLAVAGLILVMVGLNIVGSTLPSFFNADGFGIAGRPVAIAPSAGYGGGVTGVSYDYAVSSDYYDYGKGMAQANPSMPELSARNVAIMYPSYGGTSGADAEEYEVAEYSAHIETRKLDSTCKQFEDLKKRSDVVFENSNSSDRSCSFSFKVKHESVAGVLTWLKDLHPKDLTENTYTIKNQVEDYTSETDILTKKRASIDDTLAKALSAYDEITRLATNTQNADALAKIIDSKIQIIERLTQERININEQLDRLARAKSQELDRLDYTYFYVSVYENKYIDLRQLGDSWKGAVKQFVLDINKFLQDLSINLITVLLTIALWALYGLIALVFIKYGWKFTKHIWNK